MPKEYSADTAAAAFYPGHHFQRMKGLGDVIVGSHGEARNFISILGLCRQHDNGTVGGLPDFSADFLKIFLWCWRSMPVDPFGSLMGIPFSYRFLEQLADYEITGADKLFPGCMISAG